MLKSTLFLGNGLLFFERLGFYLLLLYLIPHLASAEVRLNQMDVFPLLLIFTNAGAFARIFGGLIVDALTGTRLAIQISIGLQLLGVILLTRTNLSLIYIGMIPYVLGQALFMPALLKWNTLQIHENLNKIPVLNYSNFVAINCTALAIYGIEHFFLKNGTVPFTLLFLPILTVGALSVFLRSKKKESELIGLIEATPPPRSNKYLALAILGFVLFYFFFNVVNKQLGITSNVYDNLKNVARFPKRSYLLWIFLAIGLVPGVAMGLIAWFRNLRTYLLSGVFLTIVTLTSTGIFFIVLQLIREEKISLAIVAIHLTMDALIGPLLLAVMQKNSSTKHVASWIGLVLSFSGFLCIYIGDKIFSNEGRYFAAMNQTNVYPAFLFSIAGFGLLASLFYLLYMKKRDKRIRQFEDLEEL